MTVAGLALLRLREYRAARLALDRALKLQPNQFDAAATLAELNFGLGNGRRGLELLQIAARLRPREFPVWLTMGKVLNDLGDFPKAIQAYERALGLKPDDREALVGLIGCLMGTDLPDQAEPWVAQRPSKKVSRATLQGVGFMSARVAFDANRLDEAIALADHASLGTRSPESRRSGDARQVSRRPGAMGASVARRRTRPGRLPQRPARSLQLLQKIQTRMGLTDRAAITQGERVRARDRIARMNRLNEELNLHPEDPKLRWTMGQTAWEGGSFLLASRCFEAALALDPKFQQARASLAALRAAQPDLARSPGRSTLFLPRGVGTLLSPSSVTSP